jgi:hypothetical protein
MMPDRTKRLRTRRWVAPPDCMSCDEIRWWITELLDHHGWPNMALARTLGLKYPTNLRGHASGRVWLWPTRQMRFSRVLKRIISGELVCRRLKYYKTAFPGWSGVAVIADHPVPLKMRPKMQFDLKTGRLSQVSVFERPAAKLPSFKTLLDNPERWRCLDEPGWKP